MKGQVIWARALEKRSPLTPHYWCRVAALLSQTSRDHSCGRVTWQVLMRGTPLDHRCGRVAQLALERRRVQWHCPRAPTPEPGKGHRPKNRRVAKLALERRRVQQRCPRAPTPEPAFSKAKSGSARVFCLLPVLACLCRGFPGSGSLVLRPCPFGFLFVFVPPDVSFYWPRASRSSSQREGRRVSAGAPTQEPALSRYPFTYVEVVFKFAVAFVFLFFFVLRLCTTTLFFYE